MPRFVIALAVVVGVLGLGMESGHAYGNGRWCAFVGMGSGVIRSICHFNDFNACVAEVISGDRGHCGANPNWSGQAAKPARPR